MDPRVAYIMAAMMSKDSNRWMIFGQNSQLVIPGWHVRRAYEGVAILEGQPGVIEAVLGQDVPNLGRIEEIKYENGRWQVLTSKGVILPAR